MENCVTEYTNKECKYLIQMAQVFSGNLMRLGNNSVHQVVAFDQSGNLHVADHIAQNASKSSQHTVSRFDPVRLPQFHTFFHIIGQFR